MRPDLDDGDNSGDFLRAREILHQTATERPTIEEVRELDERLGAILARLIRDRDAARAEASAR